MIGRVIQGSFLPRRAVPPPPPPGPRGSVQPQRTNAPAVQRHGNGTATQLPGHLATFSSVGGHPLPDSIRQRMESAFGASFSDVRVHVGPHAQAIGAIAFTHGSNIHFAPGSYNPQTVQGRQLLGHELTHVLQQRAGRVTSPFVSGVAVVQDAALEAEADRLGARAAVFEPIQQSRAPSAPRPAGASGMANTGSRRDQPGPAPATRAPRTAQPMDFARFRGFSRVFNWFYDDDEERLLAAERGIEEQIQGLLAFYADPDLAGATIPAALTAARVEFQQIKTGVFQQAQYVTVRGRLARLRGELDRLSTQQTILLYLADTFGGGSPQTVPALRQLLADVQEFAASASLRDAPTLRHHLDALSQWVSDSVLRLPTGLSNSVLAKKHTIARAAALVNEAYFLAVVKRDYDKSKARYEIACTSLRGLNLSVMMLGDAAVPKPREDWNTPFDPGALMLAAALRDARFLPDLLVGLPTGGAHAANKLAGALAVLTGRAPVLWYTRPQAVKESSKALFSGLSAKKIFREEEYDFVLDRLRTNGKRGGTLRILVVDDGAVSGGTIELARKIYNEAFSKDYPRVMVKAATIKGGGQVEAITLPKGALNTIDFVVNQTDDRAGPPSAMRDRPGASQALTYGRMVRDTDVRLRTPVEIHTTRAARPTTLAQTLS